MKKYVNKRVAHCDKVPFTQFPTFGDVDEALEHMEELVKRYCLLFRAEGIGQLLPIWQYDWKEIF